MTNKSFQKPVQLKPETHKQLLEYSQKHGYKIGEVADRAIKGYLSNQNSYDEHKSQAISKVKLEKQISEIINTILNERGIN